MTAIVVQEKTVPTLTNLTATAGVKSIVLEWNDSFESDLGSVSIYRGIFNDTLFATKIGTAQLSSQYTDSAAVSGTTYYYWIRAINVFGQENGDYTPTTIGSPLGTPVSATAALVATDDVSFTTSTGYAAGSGGTFGNAIVWNTWIPVISSGAYTVVKAGSMIRVSGATKYRPKVTIPAGGEIGISYRIRLVNTTITTTLQTWTFGGTTVATAGVWEFDDSGLLSGQPWFPINVISTAAGTVGDVYGIELDIYPMRTLGTETIDSEVKDSNSDKVFFKESQ